MKRVAARLTPVLEQTLTVQGWNLLFSYQGSAEALADEFRRRLTAAGWTIDAEEVIKDEGILSINLEFGGAGGDGRVLLIEGEQGIGVEVRLSR